MKYYLSFSLFVLFSITALAQVPQKMNYQAVIRDANENLLTNAGVGIQVSIVDATTQNAVYIEHHSASTNAQGLVTLEIGNGTVLTGSFDEINWPLGSFDIQIDTDPDGGTNYTISGTSELLSVPYAFYAQDAGVGNITLNHAYNGGGEGEGRIVFTDAGPLELIHSASNEAAMVVSTSATNSTGIDVEQSGTGWAIVSVNSNPANQLPSISGATNSNNSEGAAIKARNVGAGFAVYGEIPASATGNAAVYGSNLRTSAGGGVSGIGFHGTLGRSQSSQGYGVYGINNNPGGASSPSIAVYGSGFHGIYGESTNPTSGWAGYFTADIGVEGTGFSEGGWQTLSDQRLKKDVLPIEEALDRLLTLQGTHYTLTTPARKNDSDARVRERKQYGLMAQDVASVFPEMIEEKAMFLNTGDETVYQTVAYSQLIPVLIEALREMKTELDALKAVLQELQDQ